MGIKFRCHACDKKLHVKSFLAGKRGICPNCGAKFRIPAESQIGSKGIAAAPSNSEPKHSAATVSVAREATPAKGGILAPQPDGNSVPADAAQASMPSSSEMADPIDETPDAVWYVRPPGGGQYGPAGGDLMRRWLEEGRVAPESLVWREGWSDWKVADTVFPTLARQTEPVAESIAPLDEVTGPVRHSGSRAARSAIGSRGKERSGRRSKNNNVAIITVLSILCVILLVALVLVLRGNG